ncbi:hypothetical protein BU15DRAFT_83863 [Melanogaster broomeanus]|nr:hypothetical protein BU15DRAFT_83863 [Melanogaster broomeanus]
MDQGADGVSLAAPASSPMDGPHDNTAARGPGESTTDQTADGVSLAVAASSPNEHGVETSMDETTNVDTNEIAAPPNHTARVQNHQTAPRTCRTVPRPRVHNNTCTGKRHDTSAHGKGRCTQAERPGSTHEQHGCTRAAVLNPQTGLLKTQADTSSPARQTDPGHAARLGGERGHQPLSGRANGEMHTPSQTKAVHNEDDAGNGGSSTAS